MTERNNKSRQEIETNAAIAMAYRRFGIDERQGPTDESKFFGEIPGSIVKSPVNLLNKSVGKNTVNNRRQRKWAGRLSI